jgi:prolyl-tRNA synthetase
MIDKEMLSIGAHKVKLPHLLSSASWKTTGRWVSNEMYKLKDRKGSDFCLGPTHEEEITQVASSLISSYKDLPLYLYQIGTKFRDEKRPRGGLLRGKEFIMKDLYTFDPDDEAALVTYDKVFCYF